MKGHLSGTKVRVFLVWLQYTRRHVALPAATEELGPTTGTASASVMAKMNLAYFSMRSYFKIGKKIYVFFNDLATIVFVNNP